jgi:putative PEP-CTERM system histidine kinase
MAAACAITAAAMAATAGGCCAMLSVSGAAVELASAVGWCAFILYLLRQHIRPDRQIARLLVGCGILIVVAIPAFAFADGAPNVNGGMSLPLTAELCSRLALGIYGVLLTENLYRNTAPEVRWHLNLLCVGLGLVFAYSVVVYADALLFHRVSMVLWSGRAVAFTFAAPLLAVTAARNRRWAIDIHVSRAIVFHTATLVGGGIFLLALAATGEILRLMSPDWGDLVELTLVLGGVTIIGVLLTSGSARSRLRRIVLDNFFTHRYDYRLEWLKSIEILSAGPGDISVQTRVIKAIAEIVDSPAGQLWVCELEGSVFQWAGAWNRAPISAAELADGEFVAGFQSGSWVVELDDLPVRPQWLNEVSDAWLGVPLSERGELIGFVVLVRPRAPLRLDGETFDLLRIVARQAAAHIAEQRSGRALAEAKQLRDYGKHFAFVGHDVKNTANQLSMVLRNARYHLNDPVFQQDLLATLEGTLERMNGLVARLRPGQRSVSTTAIVPIEIVNEEVAALRRSSGRSLDVVHDGRTALVAIDAAAFRSVITHLCDNAIRASRQSIEIRVCEQQSRLEIDIIDKGCGMSAEFIRDKLFQPFGSTKADGFGIGAYQARELVRAAGGDLLVISRPGSGTTMRIILPCIERQADGPPLLARSEAVG